jgi:hypothetical protein
VDRHIRKAQVLVKSSVTHSYDPDIDIDWDAPLKPGKWFLPERFCTLAGTPLWESLTQKQRIRCSREELASSLATGVWTEHMLLHMVSRYVYDKPVTLPTVHFALTEVADECRHMMMFSRVLDTMGCEAYPTPWRIRESGRVLKTVAPMPALWGLLLLTEEIFERVQRVMASDEDVQPVVRMMSRIHVVEEARHISFARAELEQIVPTLSRVQLGALRTVLALAARSIATELFNPQMYARAGLDPRVAVQQARQNPRNREMRRWAGERVTGHYQQIGLIGGASTSIWRRAGFL